MLGDIEGEMLAARRIQFPDQPGAIAERVGRVLGDAAVNQSFGVVPGESREDRLAVGGAMEGKSLADARQRDEALAPWDLVDEDHRAAREDGKIDRLADLVAQGDEVRMEDVGDIGAQRSGNSRQPRANPNASAGLRLGDEILRRQRGADTLDGRAGERDLLGDLAEVKPSGLPSRALRTFAARAIT